MKRARRFALLFALPLFASPVGCFEDSSRLILAAVKETRGVQHGTGNDFVKAITIENGGNVWLGGSFSEAFNGDEVQGTSGLTVCNLARFDVGTGQFADLGVVTVNGEVRALAFDAANNQVFIGGQFTEIDGTVRNRIARFNPVTQAIEGVSGGGFNGFDGSVNALLVEGDFLYAGGEFGAFDDGPATLVNRIARFGPLSGVPAWEPLNGAVGDGVGGGNVHALAATAGGQILVGGSFMTINAGGNTVNRVAQWNPGTPGVWAGLGVGFADGQVNALAVHSTGAAPTGDIYAGGTFTALTGDAPGTTSGIAWFDLSLGLWTQLGAGVNGVVNALSIGDSSVQGAGNLLYIGGLFNSADGAPAGNLALVDDLAGAPTVGPLGQAGTNGQVFAIDAGGVDARIGGDFDLVEPGQPEEAPVKNVATATSNGTNLGRLQ